MSATAATATYSRPWLADYQLDALFCGQRYAVVEASSKAGKTVGCIVWLLEQAMQGKAGLNYWWVAPIYSQAKIAYTRSKRALPRELYRSHDGDQTITLLNGAVIWFKGADKPDSLYGEDVYAAVIDEASRCKEESWHAVRSTLTATQGPIRIIGNVKGRRNWAYNLARRAESGDDASMHYAKITAHEAVEAGILDAAEIADAKSKLPDAVFRELYLAEPSDDSGNPFGIAAIKACIADKSTKKAVAYGLDLAKSGDWCVLIGLDESGHVCVFERWHAPAWEHTIQRVTGIVQNAQALVDSTGLGDPVLEALQRNAARGAQFVGYTFSSPSKQKLMEGLAVAIQQKQVGFPDGPIVNELEAFEYEYHRTGVSYCVAPDTRILTDGLEWKRASELVVGQGLMGFDEDAPADSKTRKWKRATVTSAGSIVLPCSRVTLEDGTSFVVSNEHQWLVAVKGGGGDFQWRTTASLRAPSVSRSPRDTPSKLVRLTSTWDTEASYEAGYLAAAFDGEGCLTQRPRSNGGRAVRLSFAQRDNAMAAEVASMLGLFGFEAVVHEKNGSDVTTTNVLGGRSEVLRFLGQIRPKRLLAKFDPDRLGTLERLEIVSVASIEPLGELPVVTLGTTSKTFVAEGFASHNSAPEGLHDDCVCALALAVNQLTMRQPKPSLAVVAPKDQSWRRQYF
jgi:hypothetical protein